MPDYQKLLRLLQKELSYQEKLVSLLTAEQTAIIKLNQEALDRCCREKEKLVEEAVQLEAARQEAMQAVAAELPSSAQDQPAESKAAPRFKELAARCTNPQIRRQLQAIGEELRVTAGTVKQLNDANSELIKNCLGLISTTVSIMRSSPETDLPTYGKKGKLTARSEDPAFTAPRSGFTRSA